MKIILNLCIALAIVKCYCVEATKEQNFQTDCNGVATNDAMRARAACLQVGGTGEFTFRNNRVIAGVTVTVTACAMPAGSQENVNCCARLCGGNGPWTKEIVTFSGANRYYEVDSSGNNLLTDRIVFFDVDESQGGNVEMQRST